MIFQSGSRGPWAVWWWEYFCECIQKSCGFLGNFKTFVCSRDHLTFCITQHRFPLLTKHYLFLCLFGVCVYIWHEVRPAFHSLWVIIKTVEMILIRSVYHMKPKSYHRRPSEGWLVNYTHKVPEQSLQRSYGPNTICMQQSAFSKTHSC